MPVQDVLMFRMGIDDLPPCAYGAVEARRGNWGFQRSGWGRRRLGLEGDGLVEYSLYGCAQSVERDFNIGEFFPCSRAPCIDCEPCHRTPVPQHLEEEVVDERDDGHKFESVFPVPEPRAFQR